MCEKRVKKHEKTFQEFETLGRLGDKIDFFTFFMKNTEGPLSTNYRFKS
jgi:hypothetical protein